VTHIRYHCVFDLRLAAHKPTSSTVVIRHYAVTHKLDRENLLVAFCHYQYVNPAEAKALTILAARGQGNANVFSFGQPPQSKQPRFFPQLSMAHPPEPSTSATSVRDVPASPRASKKRKQPDTKTPTPSARTPPASATKQCRNTQRQQRYAIAAENVIRFINNFNDTNNSTFSQVHDATWTNPKFHVSRASTKLCTYARIEYCSPTRTDIDVTYAYSNNACLHRICLLYADQDECMSKYGDIGNHTKKRARLLKEKAGIQSS